MPRIEPFIDCMTESFEHPLDRLAGAVIAFAIYDATKDLRKTKRNKSRWIRAHHSRRRQARVWLRENGVYWLEALGLEPAPILEAICDD